MGKADRVGVEQLCPVMSICTFSVNTHCWCRIHRRSLCVLVVSKWDTDADFLHSRVDLTTQHILRKVNISLFSIEVLTIGQRWHVLRKVNIFFQLTSWQTRHVCTWNLTNSSAPRLSLLVIAQLLVFKDRESLRLQFLSFCKQSESCEQLNNYFGW